MGKTSAKMTKKKTQTIIMPSISMDVKASWFSTTTIVMKVGIDAHGLVTRKRVKNQD
jgi:hypothetical protein